MDFFPVCLRTKRASFGAATLRLFALLFVFASLSARAAIASSFSTFQNAGLVVGQPNFTATNSSFTQSNTPGAVATAVSSKGMLAIANGPRVLLFFSIPTTNGATAHYVVGQTDYTSGSPATSASLMASCNGIAFSPDGTKLLVADAGNNRVLIWNTIPTQNGQAADVVIGQTSFNSKASATTARGLNSPTGILVTPSGQLLIADQVNSRVLIYNSIPTQNFAAADVVIGQSDFTSAVQGSAANRLISPTQMALTSDGRLLVSDGGTSSVRIWNSVPTSNFTAANVIIGQSDFSTSDSGTSASQLFSPVGVSVSPTGQLAIGEYNNSRALIFNSVPTSNGASADMVLGQPDFTSRQANNGGLSAKSMFQAAGVTFAPDGRLLVAAPGNNRVLVFGVANSFPTITTTTLPEAHLGQNYSFQLIGTDADSDPLAWSLASGTLPAGLSLSSSGLLSGKPTLNGISTFTVQVSDGKGGTATRSLGITVSEANSLVVNTLSDSSTNMDNVTSLREAITYANSLGTTSPQTVTFAVSGTITLTGSLPTLGILSISNTQPEGVTISGGGVQRLFNLTNGSLATLQGLTLANGESTAGGAINIGAGSLTINRCIFSGNATTGTVGGGAILQNGSGTLTVTGSTFTGNSTVTGDGGAINNNAFGKVILTECTFSGNSADDGGTAGKGGSGSALYNNNGTVTITNCTFTGNTAMNGTVLNLAQMSITGSTFSGNHAAYNGGAIVNQVTMSLTNSTITGNSVTGYGGGGIDNVGLGKLTIVHCTIAGNSTAGTVGGGGIYNTVTLNLNNSIVVGNSAPTGANIGGSAAITDQGHNLIDGDAKLGQLADNGGPTQTLALLAGSPAINRGNSTLPTDQRGVARDNKPDIGAYEYPNTPPAISNVSLSPTSPTTRDILTATPTASDAENDDLTYSYVWNKNGTVLPGETGQTLDLSKAGNGDKGDQISITIVASDGIASSPSVTSDAVTVQNSAPVVSGVSIDQTTPQTNDTLSISVGTLTDADGDTLTPTYVWKKNGITIDGQTGATLDLSVAGNGDKGDNISVVVTASDGTATSSSPSGSVTIGNSAPSISNITITPNTPTTNNTLTANVTTSDADNDPLTDGYVWKKNGTTIVGETSATLDLSVAGNGDKGDQITVTATVNDGTENSTLTSNSVTVGNTAPVISSVTIIPNNPTTNSTLTANVTASDADSDTLTYTYVWKKNGTAIIGETTATLDLSKAGNGDGGDTITVTVTASDVSNTSTAVTSAGVLVGNIAPVISSVSITPTTPTTNNVLTANFTASDVDSDTLTTTYVWKKNGTVIVGETGSTLDLSVAGNGDKGDSLTVTATISDGKGGSDSQTSTAITVQDSAPTVTSVILTPANPSTNATLTATVVASDVDDDALTYSYVWKKNGTVITGESDATLDLSKADNGDNSDVITVTVTANDGTVTSSAIPSNSVTIGNSAPVIGSVSLTPANPTTNTTLTATVTATDADSDTLTYSYVWKKNGTTIAGETGSTLNLATAGNGDNGDVITVTATVNDGKGGSASQTSTGVTIGNSAPVIGSVFITPTNPKTNDTLTANVTTSDADTSDTLTTTYIWKKNGTVIAGETGATLDLSKAGNGDRGDQITVAVSATDGTSISSQESAPIAIGNSAPSVTSATIDNLTPVTTSLLTASGSATDADSDTLTYSYTWKKNGTVIAGETASTLDLSKAGNGDKGDVISVVVTADDGHGGTNSKESQSVTVAGSAPTSLALNPSSIAENQPVGTNVGTFTTAGVDAGNSYTYSLVSGTGDTDNTAFKIAGDALLSNRSFDFESRKSYSIRVQSVDGDGKAVEAAFTVTINDVNEAPSARVTLSPSSPTTNTLLQATASGSDPDGNALTFTYQWKKGDAVLVGETRSSLDLSKTGNGDKGDKISVVVTANDGTLSSPSASATVTVGNSAPTLANATFTGRENQPLSAQLAGQDADKEALTYALVTRPRFGTLALQGNGAFTYTPTKDWNGSDNFQARVRDGSGVTATATFTLTIAPVNGIPVAVADVVKGTEDTPLSIAASTLLKNDSNGEKAGEVDALKIIKVTVPTGFPGTLKLDVNAQTILFTPKLNWNGTTTFTYTVQDSGKATATAQVTLQIAAVNDAPVAAGGRLTVLGGVMGELPLVGSDVEGDALTFALSVKPTNGTAQVVKVGDNWVLRYQSKVGFSGTDTLSVIARDGHLNSAPATVTITVKPNSAPQLVSLLPNKGTWAAGSTVVFEQRVRDLDGTANLDATALLIGNSATTANAKAGATLWFDAVGNQFTLTKDDGVTTLAPVALGGTLENSQVKVTLGTGDVARAANGTLTLKWHVTFKPTFVGTKSLWMRAEDLGGLSAGFTNAGTLTLTAPAKEAPIGSSAPVS